MDGSLGRLETPLGRRATQIAVPRLCPITASVVALHGLSAPWSLSVFIHKWEQSLPYRGALVRRTLGSEP